MSHFSTFVKAKAWFLTKAALPFRLMKKVVERATYPELMQHQFLKHHAAAVTDIAAFVAEVLDNSTEEDEKEKKA